MDLACISPNLGFISAGLAGKADRIMAGQNHGQTVPKKF